MFFVAYLYHINKADSREDERFMPVIFSYVANALMLFNLSAEAIALFNAKLDALRMIRVQPSVFEQTGLANQEYYSQLKSIANLKSLSLSVIWAVYASILMIIGIISRAKSARLLAIIIFIITVLKVFLYDIRELSEIYRILSFITLGVILLVVSFLFYKYKDRIKAFLIE